MDLPKPVSLVNGFLFADETTLFIARQKEGKSMLMLQLCLDVATGRQFLGRYGCSQGKVLYIDYENRPYRIQERVSNLLKGHVVPDNFYFYALDNLSDRDVSLGNMANFQRLEAQVDELRPELLVIDPLRYAADGELDEKHSLDIVENVARLKSKNSPMAVVLVHHVRKSTTNGGQTSLKVDPRSWVDNVFGSQALLAHVESIWGMQKSDDGYTFASVPRSQAALNIQLSKDADSEKFEFETETKQSLTPAELEAWKKLGPSFTWTEGCALGIPNSTFGRMVKKAVESGLARQDRETKQYRKLAERLGEWEVPPNTIM
jgi:hypothetical protein